MTTELRERRVDLRRDAPVAAAAPPRTLPERLIQTPAFPALTICRVVLGAVMFAHASQKVFGWFGGPGLSGAYEGFTRHLGLPAPVAALAIAAEFLGSIGLVVGFLGRLSALAVISIMVGAIALVHAPNGFFMNWMGKQPGEGYEYHLLAIGLALPVLLRGSGAVSIDRLLGRALGRRRAEPALPPRSEPS